MMEAVRLGDEIAAANLQAKTDRISSLYQKGRTLSQMIPALKVLMKTKGLCSGEVMPPMIPMSVEEEEIFLAEVKDELNLLNIE
jgi:4-hydroxy-tetrahydrodipicolinate synthase